MDAVYPDGYRFQQNNNPKHRSALFKDFMSTNQINWWEDWLSESPDLNPIEMVWNLMKCRLANKSLQTKKTWRQLYKSILLKVFVAFKKAVVSL
jgi:acyl carrier protein phosphodiesterase